MNGAVVQRVGDRARENVAGPAQKLGENVERVEGEREVPLAGNGENFYLRRSKLRTGFQGGWKLMSGR